jgi:hypothetical protein
MVVRRTDLSVPDVRIYEDYFVGPVDRYVQIKPVEKLLVFGGSMKRRRY